MLYNKEFNLNTKSYLGIFVTSTLLLGCANTSQTNSVSVVTQPASSLGEVPNLKVVVDCGPCIVKPSISTLIIEGYNEAAGKEGRQVSVNKEANLTIKEYTARNDAARFLAGTFAGKDEIKAVIIYQGKTYAVEDYYRNAWLGIDTLAKKIGELSYAELK
jgi:hypothetical protein